MTVPTEQMGGTDVAVVGSGIAGLFAALTAATRGSVTLLTKGAVEDGCTRWAQGGVAAALGSDDSAQRHYDDTIAAGRGLCHPDAVRVLVEEAPARVHQMMEWGVHFDTTDGGLLLAREAAHSRARVVHARGDGTGLEIETALVRRLREAPVRVVEHARARRLITDAHDRCVGVQWTGANAEAMYLPARATILASGGAAALWPLTTNPSTSTGDGIALAFDAGAEVAGMEFMQFHPTALAAGASPRLLISEALRGAGATVVNADGHRFLLDVDERGELAGRDVVSHAIWDELQRSGADHVFLDCTGVADVAARFPAIHRACATHGLLLERDLIPIAPAAHYTIGGVRTDVHGATSVAGLYACGEVASTGVHGANRLASNSLLESAVFGSRAGMAACAGIAEAPEPPHGPELTADADAAAGEVLWNDLRRAMWSGAGILRNDGELRRSLATCEAIRDSRAAAEDARLHASATSAALVCTAALQREETRGCHIRLDHPHSREQWHGDVVMHRERGARRVDCT